MSLHPGTYKFGPRNGELLVKTGRAGIAAKAGKDLTLEVGEWEGVFEVGDDPSQMRVELTADGGSLSVQDDRGGVTTLTDPDKASVRENIDDHVLKQSQIKFRSTSARQGDADGHVCVEGELEILGQTSKISFELVVGQPSDEEGDDEDDAQDAGKGDEGDEAGDGDGAGDARDAGKRDDGDDSDDDDSPGDDGEQVISATAIVRQSDFGIDQYSTLMGMIKASDEVEVAFSAKLREPQ